MELISFITTIFIASFILLFKIFTATLFPVVGSIPNLTLQVAPDPRFFVNSNLPIFYDIFYYFYNQIIINTFKVNRNNKLKNK